MGNAHGASGGDVLWKQKEQAPELPYCGPPVHYYFIAGGLDSSVLCPMVKDSYKQGRQLLTLRKKPLSRYYFGIFREPSADINREEQRQLRVLNLWMHGQQRSSLQLKMEGEGKKELWVTDHLCLADAIAHNVKQGEQLICVSMTNEQKSYSPKNIPTGIQITPGVTRTVWCPHDEQLPFEAKKNREAIRVELYFEKLLSRQRERFVYNVARVPVTVTHMFGDRLGLANIFCDWSATLNQYLSQGWKLVDIFTDFRPPPEQVDSLAMTQFQYTYGSGDSETTVATWNPVDMDTLWIFEKPASMEYDPTPIYEGRIVPFTFQVGNDPKVYWDDVIRDMGRRGWELACFVERASASRHQDGFIMNSLLFFQRPLPPPSYNDL